MSVIVNIGEMIFALLNRRIVNVLLGGVILIVLFAGLRPYASYSDEWVSFNSQANQTEFGYYGLATGKLDDAVSIAIWQQSIEISMTVQLSRPPDNRFQVLTQIDSPGSVDPLIIGQWQSNLIIMSGRDYRSEFKFPRLSADLSANSADLSANIDTAIDVVVILTPDMTSLNVNQQLIAQGPAIPFNQAPDRISIGNAPDGGHGWTGSLQHFQLQSTTPGRTRAQYQFDKDNFPAIAESDDGTNSLVVPEPGHFPDRAWIGALRINDLFHGNLFDVIINFLGFTPFGFLMCAALPRRNRSYSGLQNVCLTILTGFLLSLAIESAQSFIPGRSPHVHDLLLNTLGTAAGAISLLIMLKLWRRIRTTASAEHPPTRNPESSENP
ncbi:VanZ family protein [Granulosicoccus antarcticus]|uniref:VanZ-like domain-containing protein n=1 Tax=Granulosicoccus antarcticus IMCC3135 TaxID=1192854 RepID=A0A2Z2NXR4_9GAMM|nr:VanZ family protein [Granulosicoccus antarcticus]ASJ74538.1 hypothetical protein IMCC3135_22340 [Granulosicoccus antarcticus IMCC3135]